MLSSTSHAIETNAAEMDSVVCVCVQCAARGRQTFHDRYLECKTFSCYSHNHKPSASLYHRSFFSSLFIKKSFGWSLRPACQANLLGSFALCYFLSFAKYCLEKSAKNERIRLIIQRIKSKDCMNQWVLFECWRNQISFRVEWLVGWSKECQWKCAWLIW